MMRLVLSAGLNASMALALQIRVFLTWFRPRPFFLADRSMEQHEPGQPPQYDLHAWIWQANPSGIFAMFNPNVSCQ
jgi:hypothetical protein